MATRHLTVKLIADSTEFRRALARAGARVRRLTEQLANRPQLRRLVARWHRSHPAPLCIDGAAYARKRKARRRHR